MIGALSYSARNNCIFRIVKPIYNILIFISILIPTGTTAQTPNELLGTWTHVSNSKAYIEGETNYILSDKFQDKWFNRDSLYYFSYACGTLMLDQQIRVFEDSIFLVEHDIHDGSKALFYLYSYQIKNDTLSLSYPDSPDTKFIHSYVRTPADTIIVKAIVNGEVEEGCYYQRWKYETYTVADTICESDRHFSIPQVIDLSVGSEYNFSINGDVLRFVYDDNLYDFEILDIGTRNGFWLEIKPIGSCQYVLIRYVLDE